MELRHLRYFVAVAETCHFGQAAAQLHVAQPALSQAIRQLEDELGAVLLQRTTRQVSLTAAGEFFRGETLRLLDGMDDAVQGVQRIAQGNSGLLRLGVAGAAAFSHLPRISRAIKARLPGVALDVQADLLTPTHCDALRSGSRDLGLLRLPIIGDGLASRVIDVEPLILAVPVDHRLAAETAASLSNLRGEQFIGYQHEFSAVNSAVLRACRAVGFIPQQQYVAPGTTVLLALVASGLGIAVVPAGVRALALDGLVYRDLVDGGSVELGLAWRDGDPNPVVAEVLSVLETLFPQPDATVTT